MLILVIGEYVDDGEGDEGIDIVLCDDLICVDWWVVD